MDKPLARLTKKRREKKPKVQKSEVKKEKGQWILMIYSPQIKREYYGQSYAKKFDNLEEMDNFLET